MQQRTRQVDIGGARVEWVSLNDDSPAAGASDPNLSPTVADIMRRTVDELREISQAGSANGSPTGMGAGAATGDMSYAAVHDALQQAARASRLSKEAHAGLSASPSPSAAAGRNLRPPSQPGRRQNPRPAKPGAGAQSGRNNSPGAAAAEPPVPTAATSDNSPACANSVDASLLEEMSRNPIHDWGRRGSGSPPSLGLTSCAAASLGYPSTAAAAAAAARAPHSANHLNTGGFNPQVSVPLDAAARAPHSANHLNTGGFNPQVSVPLDALSDTSTSVVSTPACSSGAAGTGTFYRHSSSSRYGGGLMATGTAGASRAAAVGGSGTSSGRASPGAGVGSSSPPSLRRLETGAHVDYRANAARLAHRAPSPAAAPSCTASCSASCSASPRGPVPIESRAPWMDPRSRYRPAMPYPLPLPAPMMQPPPMLPHASGGTPAPAPAGILKRQPGTPPLATPLVSSNSSPDLRDLAGDWEQTLNTSVRFAPRGLEPHPRSPQRSPQRSPPPVVPPPPTPSFGLRRSESEAFAVVHRAERLSREREREREEAEPDMTQALLVADHGLGSTIDVERRRQARERASKSLRRWVDYCTTQLRQSALHLRCDIHFQEVRIASLWQRWRREVAGAKDRQRKVLTQLKVSHGAEMSAEAYAVLRHRALFWMLQGLLPASMRVRAAALRAWERSGASSDSIGHPRGEDLTLQTLAHQLRRKLSMTLADWLGIAVNIKRQKLRGLTSVRTRKAFRLLSPRYTAFIAWQSFAAMMRALRSRLGAGVGNFERHALLFAFSTWAERVADGYATHCTYVDAAARLLNLSTRGAWSAWLEALEAARQTRVVEKMARLAFLFEIGRGWRSWKESATAYAAAFAAARQSLRVWTHGALLLCWQLWDAFVKAAEKPRQALRCWLNASLLRALNAWIAEARMVSTVDGPARAALLCALHRGVGAGFRTWAQQSARHVAARRAVHMMLDGHRLTALQRLREYAQTRMETELGLISRTQGVVRLRLRLALSQWLAMHALVLEAFMLRRAFGQFVQMALATAWRTWAEAWERRVERLKMLSHAVGRLRMQEVARGWLQWLEVAILRRESIAVMSQAARRLANLELVRAWNELMDFSAVSREVKRNLSAAITRMRTLELGNAWNEMKEVLGVQRQQKANRRRVLGAFAHLQLRRAWNSLTETTAALKASAESMRRVASVLLHRDLSRAWSTLVSVLKANKASVDSMRHVIQVLLAKDLYRAWATLVAVLEAERANLAALRTVVMALRHRGIFRSFHSLASHASASIARHDSARMLLHRLVHAKVLQAFTLSATECD